MSQRSATDARWIGLVCLLTACWQTSDTSDGSDPADTPREVTPGGDPAPSMRSETPPSAGMEAPADDDAPSEPRGAASSAGNPAPSPPMTDPAETPPDMPDEPPAAGSGGTGEQPPPNCLQGDGADFTQRGPYSVSTLDVEIGALGAFTIFLPEPLGGGCAHPIVAWANGSGVSGTETYAFYHEHAASWGIVSIASHHFDASSGEHQIAAIEYLLQQNEDPSSRFWAKLSGRAGTAGHAQGAFGASAAASHASVKAMVDIAGGANAPAGPVALLCLTGTLDFKSGACEQAVATSTAPAMYANWEGGDHVTTPTLSGFDNGDAGTIQYLRLYTAWFRCFLDRDETACALFQGGADCGVCSDPGWYAIRANNF